MAVYEILQLATGSVKNLLGGSAASYIFYSNYFSVTRPFPKLFLLWIDLLGILTAPNQIVKILQLP